MGAAKSAPPPLGPRKARVVDGRQIGIGLVLLGGIEKIRAMPHGHAVFFGEPLSHAGWGIAIAPFPHAYVALAPITG